MRIGLHRGASVLAGTESVLVACAATDSRPVEAVVRAWERDFVTRHLAAPLRRWRTIGGTEYLSGRCYPFLDAQFISSVLAPTAGRRRPRALAERLDRLAGDCVAYAASGALRLDAAHARGWPAMPLPLGRVQGLLFGCGIRHRTVPMNLAPTCSATLVLAGADKDVGRGLMQSHGLPVAPGGLADSPQSAVRIAREFDAPVVLKRLRGADGDGVIVGVRGDEAVRAAAKRLLSGHRSVLVERHVDGIELRVHFIDGRIHQVFERGMRDATAPAGPGPFSAGLAGGGATGALHPDDVAMLEDFLAAHGRPGGAFDLVLPRRGARIAAGGAILEINVPSGSWYLPDGANVAARELDAWLGRDRDFVEGEGRVPVWFMPAEALDAAGADRVRAAFRKAYPAGREHALTADGGWAPVLCSRAGALLVSIDEAGIEQHGVPMHLRPRVWRMGTVEGLAERCPLLAATLLHCGEGVRFGVAD